MTILSTELKIRGQAVTTFRGGGQHITKTDIYHVVSDINGELQSVVDASLPSIGTVVSYGGTQLFVSKISSKQNKRKRSWWTGEVTYSSRGPNSEPVANLLDLRPSLEIDERTIQKPISNAKFLGVYFRDTPTDPLTIANFDPDGLQKNDIGTLRNSALETVESTRPVTLDVYRYTFMTREVKATKALRWKFNQDQISFSFGDDNGPVLEEVFEPYTILISSMKFKHVWGENNLLYFRATVTFTHDPDTWLIDQLDASTHERFFVGQFNEDGTQIAAGDDRLVESDRPSLLQAKDSRGNPISRPTKLNGYGRKLGIQNPFKLTGTEEYFLRFMQDKNQAADLTVLPFFEGTS